MRRTKIICTLGPATDAKVLRALVEGGMNVARLNFSHGDHEEHLGRVNMLKELREEVGNPVALLLDTRGPEIRTLTFDPKKIDLVEGQKLWIRHDDVVGNEKEFSVTYKDLHNDVQIGSSILIDDGLISLEVIEIKDKDVHCLVKNDGQVSGHKGINVPGVSLNLPALTEKDISDIKFGVDQDFDYVAASFVRKAADVLEVRECLKKFGGEHIRIISKIENPEGVRNFDEILEVSDGIMVARGDLGVEVPSYELPNIQKYILTRCYISGKPAITATQMLDSMIRNPRPTRAEVSDVANAVLDGTSAIMLSGETANGRYPVEALEMMNQIALSAEKNPNFVREIRHYHHEAHDGTDIGSAISRACGTAALDLGAKAIVAVTSTGRTAREMAKFRPSCPIIATTAFERTERRLQLTWGVKTIMADRVIHTVDEAFELGITAAKKSGLTKPGDIIIVSCGTPIGEAGTTNTLKVFVV